MGTGNTDFTHVFLTKNTYLVLIFKKKNPFDLLGFLSP